MKGFPAAAALGASAFAAGSSTVPAARATRPRSPDADMSFLAFHAGQYVEVRGPLRDRWLSGSFERYDWRRPILR